MAANFPQTFDPTMRGTGPQLDQKKACQIETEMQPLSWITRRGMDCLKKKQQSICNESLHIRRAEPSLCKSPPDETAAGAEQNQENAVRLFCDDKKLNPEWCNACPTTEFSIKEQYPSGNDFASPSVDFGIMTDGPGSDLIASSEWSQKQTSSRNSAQHCDSITRIDCKILPSIGMPMKDYRRALAEERKARLTRLENTSRDSTEPPLETDAVQREDPCSSFPHGECAYRAEVETRLPRISLRPPIVLRCKEASDSDACVHGMHVRIRPEKQLAGRRLKWHARAALFTVRL